MKDGNRNGYRIGFDADGYVCRTGSGAERKADAMRSHAQTHNTDAAA